MNCFLTNCIKMKQFNLLKLLSMGLLLGMLACSHDEDEPENNTPKKEQEGQQDQDDVKEDKTEYNYYGAELYTKETFKYGRFEAKMKMAYAPGCISSMFLYYNDSYMGGGKPWNELDIEVIGKDKNSFQTNIISGSSSSKVTSEQIHPLSYPVNEDYHVYAMEWTPDYAAWSVDGKEVRRTAVGDAKGQIAALVENQSLRFNLWASSSTSWVGKLNSKDIPVTQYIDYVKVYSYDEEAKTFSELWTDDFDSFDSSRWSRGNWSMELVTEKVANVVVEDGVLQLRLTKEAK